MASAAQTTHRGGRELQPWVRMPAPSVPVSVADSCSRRWSRRSSFLRTARADQCRRRWILVAMLVGLVPFGWLYLINWPSYAFRGRQDPSASRSSSLAVATAINLYAAAALVRAKPACGGHRAVGEQSRGGCPRPGPPASNAGPARAEPDHPHLRPAGRHGVFAAGVVVAPVWLLRASPGRIPVAATRRAGRVGVGYLALTWIRPIGC